MCSVPTTERKKQRKKKLEIISFRFFIIAGHVLIVCLHLLLPFQFFRFENCSRKKAIKTLKKHKIELNFDEWKNHQVRIQCDAQQGKKRNNYR